MSGRTRRELIRGAASTLVLGGAIARSAPARANPADRPPGRQTLDFRPFEPDRARMTETMRCRLDGFVLEATAPQLQSDLNVGRYSSAELVAFYIDRIETLDVDRFRSVIELNPDALTLAVEFDSERAQGRQRGPLHGLPVLLKANIGTGDRLHTTAGAVALADATSDRDAHLVAALRNAGAIILGKSNLSEWAFWMAYYAPNGFSALGGQVFSPYGESIDPFGSSTGSAVAATMNLAAMTVGTETMGSIISPAARASVVGMRPTLGLVSRDRVLPLSDECDTPGPIARTVTDVAALLTAMTAERDMSDRKSGRAAGMHGTDFMAALDPEALRGKRIGLIGVEFAEPAADDWIIANSGLVDAARALEIAGARVVVLRPGPFDLIEPGVTPAFNWGMREGVNAYLAATGAPIGSLANIVDFNYLDPQTYAPWGQERLHDCLMCPLSETEVRQLSRANRRQAREYLLALFNDEELDALAGIDSAQSRIYPIAGFPAIAVPAGLNPWGTPFALTFIARAQADADLIAMAYAFEQASRFRVPPPLVSKCRPARPTTGVGGVRWPIGLAPS